MKQQIITEKLNKIYDNDVVTEQMLDDMLFDASVELLDEFIKAKDPDWIPGAESHRDYRKRRSDLRAQHDSKMKVGAVTGAAIGGSAAVTGAALYGMYKLIKKWTAKSNDPKATDTQKAQAKEKVADLKKKVATAKKAKK